MYKINNLLSFLFRIFLLGIFRLEYAAKEKEAPLTVEDHPDPKEGYADTNTQVIPGFNAKVIAADYGLPDPEVTRQNEEETQRAQRIESERKEEEQRKAKLEEKPKEEKPKEEPAKTEDVTEIKVEDVKDKQTAEEFLKQFADDIVIEVNGEKFTKEEFLAKYEVVAAPKTYKVGSAELDQAAYDELVKKATEYYGWDAEYVKSKNEKDLLKDLATYVKAEGVELGSKALAEKNQEIAKIRRDLGAVAKNLEVDLDTLIKAKEKAAEKIKETEALLAKDPKSEDDDDKRNDLIIDQKIAKGKLEEMKETQTTREKTIEALTDRAENLFYQSNMLELQERIPEFELSEPAGTILNKANKKGFTDFESASVANLIYKIVNDYRAFIEANPDTEMTVESFYRTNKLNYNVPVKAQSTNGKDKAAEKEDEKKKKKIIKMLVSQEDSPFHSVGGGGGGHVPEKKETGVEAVKAEIKKVGGDDSLTRLTGEE